MNSNSKSNHVFKIEGMDCAEEIAILKRELSPIVGGEEYLFFDLLNAKLSIKGSEKPLAQFELIKAIEKTGMHAIPWGAPKEERTFFEKYGKLIFTVISVTAILAGFFLHAFLHGGIGHAFMAGDTGEEHAFPLVSILLYGAAIVFGSWFIFPKALNSIKNLRPDMNLLMTVAVIGAALIGEWLEAATVTVLFSFSLLLESWSVERARRATKALLDLAPDTARVIKDDGNEIVVKASEVNVGQIFIVKTGERIPLDGIVAKGNSDVNQAPITGESIPVSKKTGDQVFSGTINGSGVLEVRCEKSSENSTLSNIIRLVSEAHEQRAPSEQWVERFAKVYTPAVMALALLVLVVPPLFFSGGWNEWLYRALTLLVIACPCALVISTPVSIVAALTAAAKNGVLVKGGKFIELPAHIKAIAFDKTGTITKGELSVKSVAAFNSHTEDDLLKIASAIEVRSEHPIAKAVVLHAKSKNISVKAAEHYVAVQGKGATAQIDGKKYWLGSHRYLEEKGQESADVHDQLEKLTKSGHTVVVIGTDEHVCGFISLSDTLRSESKSVIANFHSLGIKHTVMLTGDNRGTAELISRKVGIDHFFSELLPEDKVKKVEELVKEHKIVAMIGDGVNDAPAMARSSLGIAMGVAGSDAAIESADISLMTDDLSKVPWLIGHSRKSLRIIRQNITFSLLVKAIFVVLTFTGHSSLWTAIAADMGASFIVIFNGLRLLNAECKAEVIQ
ncbi:MAG: cadmium-translocating P-type ATPase [Bdellovibrionaceae bacterium]|nr:cadmium-translocating P-type ATPase [Pseudobdellovibrionaceae bacterium]